PTDPIRVAVMVNKDVAGLGLAGVVTPLLRFNQNKTAAENGDNFTQINMPGQLEPNPDYQTAINAVLAFKPHIISPFAAFEFLNPALTIEESWTEPYRPHYILTEGLTWTEQLLTFVKASPPVRSRVRGVRPRRAAESKPVYDAFALAYKAEFQQK